MNKRALFAIMKKDFGEAMSNNASKFALILVPPIMVMFLPILMTVMAVLAPGELGNLGPALALLPRQFALTEMVRAGYYYVMNYLMPAFFLLVPIMAASVAAGSSFAGEKERRTLETLLYSPLTVHELFFAKVMGALALAMVVTACAFLGFLCVAIVGSALVFEGFVLNLGIWAVILLLIVPAMSLLGITVMVLASARAQTFQEAQQYGAILIVPVLLLFIAPQVSGLFLFNAPQLALIGLVSAVGALALTRVASTRFTPEKLLK